MEKKLEEGVYMLLQLQGYGWCNGCEQWIYGVTKLNGGFCFTCEQEED